MSPHTPTPPGSLEAIRSSEAAPAASLSDPGQWVDDYGDYLFSYAMFRLRDPVQSQDVVQETFLAALKGGGSFAGKTAERGWLVGILKHKIHDLFRKAGRETSFTDLGFYEHEEGDPFAADGLRKGGWIHALGPAAWPMTPAEGLDREEFWKTFRACASKLPSNVARAFLMRELDGVESHRICTMLNITPSNLWVMLHRARMALRHCLEANWFNPQHAASVSRKTGPLA